MRLMIASMFIAATVVSAPSTQADPLDLDQMSTEDREAFGAEIREYLLENPEVIMEAIQVLEQRREAASQTEDRELVLANVDRLYNDGFSYVTGNPDGDITVVEFLDYRCGFCKRAHPEVEEMLDRDPNIRLIVKEFPILGPDSVQAGKMALAALEIDRSKYAELGDRLMTYNGNLNEQAAYRIAGEVGYNIAALKTLANSEQIDDQLQQNYQLAQALNLQGTPAFIIGTEVVRGYLPVDQLMETVQQARSVQN